MKTHQYKHALKCQYRCQWSFIYLMD